MSTSWYQTLALLFLPLSILFYCQFSTLPYPRSAPDGIHLHSTHQSNSFQLHYMRMDNRHYKSISIVKWHLRSIICIFVMSAVYRVVLEKCIILPMTSDIIFRTKLCFLSRLLLSNTLEQTIAVSASVRRNIHQIEVRCVCLVIALHVLTCKIIFPFAMMLKIHDNISIKIFLYHGEYAGPPDSSNISSRLVFRGNSMRNPTNDWPRWFILTRSGNTYRFLCETSCAPSQTKTSQTKKTHW